MLKKRIIPCLDVKDGRVVKGINFLNLKDAGDPVEQAKIYDKGGADEICFLDITASSENRKILLDKVSETAKSCFVPLTVGGGISSIEDIKNLLLAGADKVSINTAAVKNHNFIKDSSIRFGSQCIVIAIDAKKVANNKWKYLLMEEEILQALMLSNMLKLPKKMALEKFFLHRWIRMEQKQVMISN